MWHRNTKWANVGKMAPVDLTQTFNLYNKHPIDLTQTFNLYNKQTKKNPTISGKGNNAKQKPKDPSTNEQMKKI